MVNYVNKSKDVKIKAFGGAVRTTRKSLPQNNSYWEKRFGCGVMRSLRWFMTEQMSLRQICEKRVKSDSDNIEWFWQTPF